MRKFPVLQFFLTEISASGENFPPEIDCLKMYSASRMRNVPLPRTSLLTNLKDIHFFEDGRLFSDGVDPEMPFRTSQSGADVWFQ
jgi:hypothetical protein